MPGDFASDFSADFATSAPAAPRAVSMVPIGGYVLPAVSDGAPPVYTLAVVGKTETLTIPDYRTPVDLLLFRRFGREVPHLVEDVYADPSNRGLAALGVLPPPGTQVVVTVPAPKAVSNRPVVSLYD